MITVTDCTTIINQLLPEPHAGLLSGILFGTKASLSFEFKEALIRTGTIHITALSGMNITIIANLAVTTLLRVFSRRTSSLLSVLIIIGFIQFVGPSASVVRAGIMGCMALFAVVTGRQRRALFFLFMTVVLMLLYRPAYGTELSFQLSVLATLGIILFAQPKDSQTLVFTQKPSPIYVPQWIKDDFRTTLAAQIFTVPLIAIQFHRISLIAPLANVAIGFLIAPLTVLGMILVLLGFILPILAIPLSWIVWLMLSYVISVIELFASLSLASIGW